MAVIMPVLAACGLAAGAAWAGEPIAHTPAFPPDGVFAYEPAPLPVSEPAPEPEPLPELLRFTLGGGEPGVYRWPVVKVIDGNTLKVDARGDFPPELATLNVRLRGVDTPEKGGRAKCEAERRAGRAATAFTAAAVAGGAATFRNLAWGKYGGRVLADVSVAGRSLADRLIIEGHGRAYDGGKRKPWC